MASVPRGLSDFLHRYIPEIEREMFEFLPIQEPEAFLYAPMRDYPDRGGKRFRPALVLLASPWCARQRRSKCSNHLPSFTMISKTIQK